MRRRRRMDPARARSVQYSSSTSFAHGRSPVLTDELLLPLSGLGAYLPFPSLGVATRADALSPRRALLLNRQTPTGSHRPPMSAAGSRNEAVVLVD